MQASHAADSLHSIIEEEQREFVLFRQGIIALGVEPLQQARGPAGLLHCRYVE